MRKIAEELKKRTNCIEIARMCNLPIMKEGDRCKSPLHDGSNEQSFICYKNFWYSHSDARGGDLIDLYAELRTNGSRGKAIIDLAKIFNIYQYESPKNAWDKETQSLCSTIAYWHSQLRSEDIEYLHSRNITDDTIKALRIGYSITDDALTIPYYKNKYVYDYIFRYYSGSKRYKRMKGGEDDTPWGIETLAILDKPLFLVEGTFDAISIYQNKYPVLVTTNPNIDLLRFHNVVLCYDNDDTGKKYTLRVAKKLLKNNIPFKVALFPDAHKDIADFLVNNNISNISYIKGVEYIGQNITDIDEITKYITKLSRSVSVATLSEILESTKLSENTRKLILKQATTAPTESYIADEIIEENNIIYVDQDGFYIYNDKIWEKTADNAIKLIADKHYGKIFSTAHRLDAVCKLLKARALQSIKFNKKPLVSFINGTLELDTGKFREHDIIDYCSVMMQYPYIPKAKSQLWDNFIKDVTAEDEIKMELLKFIAGYILFPDCRYQKIFALIGSGGNGKSVYIEVLQKLFGDSNCSSIEPKGLTEDFKCILVKDSLLNVSSEVDEDFSASEKILKKISAGEEVVACYKGMTHIKFYPRCKLIFACNEMPKVNVIKGLDRRMVFVNFPVKFVEDLPIEQETFLQKKSNPFIKKRDVNLLPKLMKELPAIFNWVYEGYQELLNVGYFTETREQDEYLQMFNENSNPMVVFCSEYIFEGEMTREDIYKMYQDWCIETGHKPLSREKFMPMFRDEMQDKIKEETQVRRDKRRVRIFKF